MPGSNQRYKGLLAFYVDNDGSVEIMLGRGLEKYYVSNDDMQWIYSIRASLEERSKAFLASKPKSHLGKK